MANVIDSLNFDGVTEGIFTLPYGTCATAEGTAAKVATATNFVLEPGARIAVKFTYANTVASPTLNVNSTGAKAIYWHGAALASDQYWQAGAVLDFIYNGAQWELIGVAKDNNVDTKNTAGSTNTSSKIFLVGATSQAANPQTYSHDTAYVDTDGYLYSNSEKVWPRIYSTLIPYGTAIPENADLNTVNYLKVGNFYCSANATVKTLKNCPLTIYNSSGAGTSGLAFMMQVYSPLLPTFDDETTGTWRYRIRVITQYNTGMQYKQYCYIGEPAGAANWVYGDWYIEPRSKFTFNKTAASTAAIGSATNPVYIDSTGTIQKTTYTLGASVPSNAKFTDTTYGAAGSSLGLVKSGGDVTISDGTITVNDDSHSHDTRYYTEAEIDNKISAIDWFNQGTAITTGADLNTYTTPGKYFIGSESGAQGLTNCPTSTNFCMYVLVRTSGGSKTQFIMTLNGRMYLRSCNSSGTWRDWQEYATSANTMPISGGTFTGVVTLANQSYAGGCGRNILVQNSGGTANVSTQYIIMQRK